MNVLRGTLSIALVASVVISIQILAVDDWLWNAAPTHAYGLIGFVGVDTFLVASMWRRTRIATLGTMLAGAAQLTAMLADVVVGQPEGTPSSAFRSYLLADNSFLTLLAIQVVILGLSIGTLAAPLMQHHKISFLHQSHRRN